MAGPAVGILFLLVPLGATLLPLAIFLLFIGLRGKRAGDSPVCGRCNFDLGGIATGPGSKCPECGGLLSGNLAVGRRVRGTFWIITACVVFFFSFAAIIAAILSAAGVIFSSM